MGWVIAGCGAFALCAAALNWEWFMNHRKAQFFVRIFGRTGTRVFYGLVGAALIVLGLLMAMGIIQERSETQSVKVIPARLSEYKAQPGTLFDLMDRLRKEEAAWNAAEIERTVRSQDGAFPERVYALLQEPGVESVRELCRLYLQATAEQRIFIRSKTDRAYRDKLLRFSSESAILGVQQKSEDTIRLGLVALVIENATTDPRDTVLYNSNLLKAAKDIGSDPEKLLREAAKTASQTLSEFLLGRLAVDIR